MGLVYLKNEDLVKDYPAKKEKIGADTDAVCEALMAHGQETVTKDCDSLTAGEARAILLKLDKLANDRQNDVIAAAVAEAASAVITAVRMVKKETNGSEFRGIKAQGQQLDAVWLTPQMVGGTILNTAVAGSLGLHGGTGAAVLPWLVTVGTAGTEETMIPEQSMKEEGAVVHIAVMDTVAVPKYNRVLWTIDGTPGHTQPLSLNQLDGSELAFQAWEMPIIIGPEMSQKLEIDPNIAGDSKIELLSVVIAQASDLGF